MAALPTVLPVSIPTKRLAASITATSTAFRLSNILGWNGSALTSADLGQVAYGAFRDVNGTLLELFSFDPATIASGNISFVVRGLSFNGDRTTSTAANKLSWVKGTTLVELGSDFPMLYQYLKEYIDNIAISGSPVATTTTLGISKASVAPVSPGAPIFAGDNDPRIPTQGENDAMAGTVGTPSSTNKYVTSQARYTTETDQSQATQDAVTTVGTASTTSLRNKIAQSFIPTSISIKGAKLYKTADTGSFTGTVTVTLQADTAGSPSGTALATAVLTNAQWLLIAVGEFPLLFGTEYATLTIGSTYWLVVATSTSDTANHPNLGIITASAYANGILKYNNATDGWVTTTTDLYFKTLFGITGAVAGLDSTGRVPVNASQYALVALDTTQSAQVINSSGTVTAFSITLPPGFFSTTSGIRIRVDGQLTTASTTYTSTITILLNGSTIYTESLNANSGNTILSIIANVLNNASLSIQKYIVDRIGNTAFTPGQGGNQTAAIDTSGECTIQVQVVSNSTVSGNGYAQYNRCIIERIA